MDRRAIALSALLFAGCAVGRVSDGELRCFAIGHAGCYAPCPTVVEPYPTPTPGAPVSSCARIEGGAISTGAAEMIGNAIHAAILFFFPPAAGASL